MSQPPRNRPPGRQDPNRAQQPRRRSDEYDSDYPPQQRRRSEEYDADYPPQPRRRTNAPPPQQRGRGGPPPRVGGTYYQQRPRYVQPQRDAFPYIMGGLIGAMVIGLGLVIFLIINNNNNTPTVTNPGTTPAPVGSTAPRMDLATFKALYDNPATRPIIIDVRSGQSFNEGHIAGAISVPEAEVDILLAKLPKDKLIVAYCQ